MSPFSPARPDVVDFLLTRRSHPSTTLSDPGPDEATLHRILTAAARVPDHGKLAPWRFVVYRGAARERIGQRLLEIAEAREGPLDEMRRTQELTRFTRAPVVVGVLSRAAAHPKIPVWEQELSAGAACMTLLTAASASGFGAQWLSEWCCFDETASAFLGRRDGERFAGFIHIGTPTQAPFERSRPDLDSVASVWEEG
ncbi:nitroreductase family protein [Polymorphum gilvum]|uniref:Putative NAD(P)H nitroreductase n=1 Tax=Polymorphum gilvum (strain LMG 25793 / CGMCC 1.9160 / SL003B-26A1) TaxID=991905 RepID=F2J534_POLGS|nr:nitroreductase [Polymorphum gilvum]ADZ70076.1 Nitroreductase family protein [Polymorphum gilvum SL003B-26A1]